MKKIYISWALNFGMKKIYITHSFSHHHPFMLVGNGLCVYLKERMEGLVSNSAMVNTITEVMREELPLPVQMVGGGNLIIKGGNAIELPGSFY
jgi:hypothetical protein